MTGRFVRPEAAGTWAWALGAAVVPALTERWAVRAFSTPRSFERPEAEEAWLARAVPFRFGGLAAWRWGSGPAVFLVHGWEGRGSQLGAFVPPLVARGHSVYAFDAPAHGASPGGRATLADFADALLSLEARVGSPEAVIAHSLGSLATLLAMKRGLSTRAVVLMAPPSPRAHLEWFQSALHVPDSVLAGMQRRIQQQIGESWEGVEGPALSVGVTTPALLIHDRGDKEASWHLSREMANVLADATLHLTEGLGHRKILRDAAIVDRVVDFVSRNAGTPARSPDLARLEGAA